MEVSQIFLILVVFICGLLTGYLVGFKDYYRVVRERNSRYSEQQSTLSDIEICLHETAVVRTEGSSIEGSLLVCEKCGATYGNFGARRH